ncbi:MAG: sigma-70 family RNA polymerase sigma factor [Minicystis sp.]
MRARKVPGANQGDPERARDAEAEAERQKAIEALMTRDTALSQAEIALFRQVFPQLMETHFDRVWHVLQRRGVRGVALQDLTQEVFAAWFCFACDHGPAGDIEGKLDSLAAGKAANLVRGAGRDPVTLGVPSSRSEQPRSGPDLLRALDVEAFRERLWPALSPEHRAVVDAIFYRELSHDEAAQELGIPRRTVTSRLMSARRVIAEMAELFFSPSQRG